MFCCLWVMIDTWMISVLVVDDVDGVDGALVVNGVDGVMWFMCIMWLLWMMRMMWITWSVKPKYVWSTGKSVSHLSRSFSLFPANTKHMNKWTYDATFVLQRICRTEAVLFAALPGWEPLILDPVLFWLGASPCSRQSQNTWTKTYDACSTAWLGAQKKGGLRRDSFLWDDGTAWASFVPAWFSREGQSS